MARASKSREVFFRVQMTIPAMEKLQDLSSRLGISQMHLMQQMCEWLTSQPETIQDEVLGLYPEAIKADVATISDRDHRRAAPRYSTRHGRGCLGHGR